MIKGFTDADGNVQQVQGVGYHYDVSQQSFAEGGEGNGTADNEASGAYSHAEGHVTHATAPCAHAEGDACIASSNDAHAEGSLTQAIGLVSHAEGAHSIASGTCAHAEGDGCVASGEASHAEGTQTVAQGDSQHVSGRLNIIDTAGEYAYIIGNGGANGRSNAFAVKWDGTLCVWDAQGIVEVSPSQLRQLLALINS